MEEREKAEMEIRSLKLQLLKMGTAMRRSASMASAPKVALILLFLCPNLCCRHQCPLEKFREFGQIQKVVVDWAQE